MYKKTIFYFKVVKHWSRYPREVVEAPSLEVLSSHLDTVLSHSAVADPALSTFSLTQLQSCLPASTVCHSICALSSLPMKFIKELCDAK